MSWQDFNWVDYTILAIIGFSALVSLVRGFIKEAVSLAIWISAFWISFTYAKVFSAHFLQNIESVDARVPLAFVILFLGVLIIGAIVNYIIGRLVYTTGLSGTDRVLGLVFGIARGVFLIAIVVLIAPLTVGPKSTWWRDSQLIPQFEGLAEWLHAILPNQIDELLQPLEMKMGPSAVAPAPAEVHAIPSSAPVPSVVPSTPTPASTPTTPTPAPAPVVPQGRVVSPQPTSQ